jgi:hypothetical protein
MKKVFTLSIFILISIITFSQETGAIKVIEINEEIKDQTFHIRTNKGDVLWVKIAPELRERRGTNSLKSVVLYRQFSEQNFQHIISKSDVEEIDVKINVPSDGIYTLIIERGGMRKFNTAISVYRTPKSEATAQVRKAVHVIEFDTTYTYIRDSVVYDYIRRSIPYVEHKKDTIKFEEELIFMDIAYALRIGNQYSIPIVIPRGYTNAYKKTTPIEWGFVVSVGDEVYKALQGFVADVTTEAINMGAGKVLSSGSKETASLAQKSYTVFEHASTANQVAEITGDVSELQNSEKGSKGSEVVATVTSFTTFTGKAGDQLAKLTPKISDKVKWNVVPVSGGSLGVPIANGTNGYVAKSYKVQDIEQVYRLEIKNERDVKGEDLWMTLAQLVKQF